MGLQQFVEQAQKSFLTRNDMNYILTELKQSESWLYNYHSKMLQMVSTQLEGAEKSLIERSKKGHRIGQLRFARYNEFRTFTYNQSGFKLETQGDKTLLCLSKIGYIRIKKHRDTPEIIKQVIVTKTRSCKWYACVTCELDRTIPPKIDLSKAVGIDVGIKSFAYDSDEHNTKPIESQKDVKTTSQSTKKSIKKNKRIKQQTQGNTTFTENT